MNQCVDLVFPHIIYYVELMGMFVAHAKEVGLFITILLVVSHPESLTSTHKLFSSHALCIIMLSRLLIVVLCGFVNEGFSFSLI